MMKESKPESNDCKLKRLFQTELEQQRLTGGLVAAFRDSISAWVIHTLLLDCKTQEEA